MDRVEDVAEQLAEALAAAWSCSRASAAACAAMRRLLPGLQYLSVVLAYPGQPGCLVAAANCAGLGPLELSLHDIDRCAAGQSIAHGKPLQASLPAGSAAAAAAAAAWSDVAQTLGSGVPGITYLLCLPFGTRGSSNSSCGNAAAAGDGSAPQEAQLDSSADSSTGALLCGFAAAPHLGAHHRAALAALLRHLPAATAQLSGGTLEFVSYVCGASAGADCCCESGQGTEGETHCRGCRPASLGPDGAGRSGAASLQHTAVPTGAVGRGQPADPSLSVLRSPCQPPGGSRSEAPARAAAGEAGCASSAMAVSPTDPPARQHGFSKGLLAHVAAQPGALRRRSPLCLRFSSSKVEQQYCAWVAPAQLWTDMLSSVLILAAMLIVALREPFQLWYNSPATLALSLGMLAPLAFTTLSGPRYAAWRDVFVALFRLYAVVFACTAGIPAISVPLPPERVHHWAPFWRRSGAESLLATALGFLLRQRLHVPVQAASLAVALSSLPTMCAQSFPDGCHATCLTRGALTATLLGCAVPALLLRSLEQRSRAMFAGLLRAAAADC